MAGQQLGWLTGWLAGSLASWLTGWQEGWVSGWAGVVVVVVVAVVVVVVAAVWRVWWLGGLAVWWPTSWLAGGLFALWVMGSLVCLSMWWVNLDRASRQVRVYSCRLRVERRPSKGVHPRDK